MSEANQTDMHCFAFITLLCGDFSIEVRSLVKSYRIEFASLAAQRTQKHAANCHCGIIAQSEHLRSVGISLGTYNEHVRMAYKIFVA